MFYTFYNALQSSIVYSGLKQKTHSLSVSIL